MALFQYDAIDSKGRKKKGVVEAEHESAAEQILFKKNIVVTNLQSYSLSKKIKLSKKEILTFTEELTKLLQAGIPLYESISIIKEKYDNEKIYTLILDLSDQIKRGKNFSEALAKYPDSFDFIYCSMIRNAEKTGELIATLEELASIMRKSLNLRKKITGALLYPAILGVFCLVVIFSLLFYVVPSLFDLFDGRNLHPITNFVLAVSKFANSFKGLLFYSLIIFVISIIVSLKVKKIRNYFYQAILSLPVLKKMFIKLSLIKFCRSFSVLLATGISYVEALKLAKSVMKHPMLEKEISYAEERVIEGDKLSFALNRKKKIPTLAIRMLEIAEESGKMVEMLTHIAKIYNDELEKELSQLTTILQPLLLLILGGIVGFIVLSVLLPLTDVSSFVA